MEASQEGVVCIPAGHVLRIRWLEPLVATVTFAVAINVFRLVEAKGDARAATAAIFDLRKSTRLLRAGAGYWVGIFLLAKVLPRAEVDWSCDAAKVSVDLVVGVVAYDFCYYWFHRGMHRWPRFGRLVSHATHHAPFGALRAHHVLEHSFLDGSMQVLTNVLVQRYGLFGPRNWLARLLHNVVVTYLLTESHADLGGLAGRFPALLKGAARHRLHHHHAGPPYEQFFGYLDDLFSPVSGGEGGGGLGLEKNNNNDNEKFR
mmetsp:Transcript_8708/g.28500  ORF Transcript_8708/g.28500 Transcript_8708/m.28500 type:complete len:260 (+) Transcript_8708:46-825(+)